MDQFEKACALEKRNAVNFELCAQAMIALGERHLGEARGKLQFAASLNPYSVRARVLKCTLAKAKAGVEVLSLETDINLLRELYAGYNEAAKLDIRINVARERRDEVAKILKQIGAELPEFKAGVSEEVSKLRSACMIALQKKKLAEAFNSTTGCVDGEPDNPMNHTLRSLVLSKIKKKAKGDPASMAILDAKHALRLHHGDGESWAALALAYQAKGELDWALEAWMECERHAAPLLEVYAKERQKLQKEIHKKGKHFERRDIPWKFDESAAPLAGSEQSRSQPMLEVDSMGGMTVRSQLKRVMLSNKNAAPRLDLSPRPSSDESKPSKSPRPGPAANRSPASSLAPPPAVPSNTAAAAAAVAKKQQQQQRSPSDKDPDLDRFCRLIGGKVTRQEAAQMTESDIPAHLPLPDKLFLRGFVANLK